MNNILYNIKKTGLFLFGVVLIILGYRANTSVNGEAGKKAEGELPSLLKELEENIKQKQEAQQALKEEKAIKPVKSQLPPPIKPESKKVETQTVIEKETPEEASGTE